MTEEEKYVAKEMNRMILKLTYERAVHLAVLKKCVSNWKEEFSLADSSMPLKEFHKTIDEARGAADILIDKGQLAAAYQKGMVH